MYLTDFRENTLQDVITKLESELFLAVTGLTVKDFCLLVRLKVFNTEQMNQAVFAFRRYEDASLRYTGIESHEGLTHYGLYDTVVARESQGGDRALDACRHDLRSRCVFANDEPESALPLCFRYQNPAFCHRLGALLCAVGAKFGFVLRGARSASIHKTPSIYSRNATHHVEVMRLTVSTGTPTSLLDVIQEPTT